MEYDYGMKTSTSEHRVKEKLDLFFHQYPLVIHDKKHVLIYGGEEPPGVIYLESGAVRQYDISGKTGTELTLHIYNPGSFFPLTWAMAGIPNRHFFQAMRPAQVRVCPRDELLRFIRKDPEVLFSLNTRLLAGLDNLMTRLEYQVFSNSYSRVIAELVYLARHFGTHEGSRVFLDEQLTHQDIADLTGMVRETVSVAMEKLVAQGLIQYQEGRIVIDTPDKLSEHLSLAV